MKKKYLSRLIFRVDKKSRSLGLQWQKKCEVVGEIAGKCRKRDCSEKCGKCEQNASRIIPSATTPLRPDHQTETENISLVKAGLPVQQPKQSFNYWGRLAVPIMSGGGHLLDNRGHHKTGRTICLCVVSTRHTDCERWLTGMLP